MSMDVTSSTAGAAVALRQAQGQTSFGIKALQSSAQQDSSVATLLAGGGSSGGQGEASASGTPASGSGSGGGYVTATRGQNLNIVV